MSENRIHLIGNAHIDPVWLWRYTDGFAEIKATFRSALDRINEYDGFVFTSACALYYKWIEENCPEMFEEIKTAVGKGRWSIVGGMWIQPDCNIPSAESFARHLLYSQRYFKEKFGITVTTGYNVDSFGHNASMPKILSAAGIDRYVYMRPAEGAEKKYPFPDHAYRWKCGENEVVAFRIYKSYAHDVTDTEILATHEELADNFDYDFMMFYGVGNHGGGPTIKNIETILSYQNEAKKEFIFSTPDKYFDGLDKEKLPVYEGELQNHASGCYSANSKVKELNRKAENMLTAAEKLEVLASHIMGYEGSAEANAKAWQWTLFNQFHDIICGCSVKAAYDDAYAFFGASIAHAGTTMNAAAQKISWAVDTSKGVTPRLTKETNRVLWEADNLGTPIVIFNPLSHPVKVPVYVHIKDQPCTSVTDENENPMPFQIVRGDYTNHDRDMSGARFIAEVPAFGWRTYWSYRDRDFGCKRESSEMTVTKHSLSNGILTVTFDKRKGFIRSIKGADGKEYVGRFASRAFVIDDSKCDTWSHNTFVFDKVVGEFKKPTFTIFENGPCEVSLCVRTKYKNSTLEQVYTLYKDDEKLHVKVRLVLNEELRMIKLGFDSGIKDARFVREIPAGYIETEADGREEPMLRYMAMVNGKDGLAVVNNSKYSSSAKNGEMYFVCARSCYYADHYAVRDDRLYPQDIGEHEFAYTIMPYKGDFTPIENEAEELNTVFMAIPETYHKGELAQVGSFFSCDKENVTVTAIKYSEDGKGTIVRFAETSGRNTEFSAEIFGKRVDTEIEALGMLSFYIDEDCVRKCSLTELD